MNTAIFNIVNTSDGVSHKFHKLKPANFFYTHSSTAREWDAVNYCVTDDYGNSINLGGLRVIGRNRYYLSQAH